MANDFLVINGLTHHWPRNDSLNEQNIGLGYERRFGDYGFGGGVLKDSFSNWSPYIQGTWFPWELGPLSLGATGSLSYRQEAEGNPYDGLTLAPMLSAEYMMTDDSGFNLGLIPPITGEGLALLQYKHRFGTDEESQAAEELRERLERRRGLMDIEDD